MIAVLIDPHLDFVTDLSKLLGGAFSIVVVPVRVRQSVHTRYCFGGVTWFMLYLYPKYLFPTFGRIELCTTGLRSRVVCHFDKLVLAPKPQTPGCQTLVTIHTQDVMPIFPDASAYAQFMLFL